MANRSLPAALAEAAARGAEVSPAYALTNRFGGGKTTESKVVESIGENVLATPATGQAITLYWIALETSEESASEVLAEVKVGTLTPYTWFLGKPGAFMHWEPILGAPEAKLVVKLSAAVKVACSFSYTEG